ncbi:MAG TPA: helix-turn-helix domain-containing protein [Prosthecobacter sp.]
MNTISSFIPAATAPVSLSDEQRVLLEQVSASPRAFADVRRRARALLMLGDGLPLREITAKAAMDKRTVSSLLRRHREGGVRTALLGQKPSRSRLCWLALCPMG